MTAVPSLFSLAAAGLYLAVIASAILASLGAGRRREPSWHLFVWLAVAAVFLGLAIVRVFAFEEIARAFFRGILQAEGAYEKRRAVQEPLFAIIFATASAILAGFVYFVANRVRGAGNVLTTIAGGCAGGMVFLLILRILSLHAVEELLYGPLKLNWVSDIGMSLVAMGCAVRYLSAPPSVRPQANFIVRRRR